MVDKDDRVRNAKAALSDIGGEVLRAIALASHFKAATDETRLKKINEKKMGPTVAAIVDSVHKNLCLTLLNLFDDDWPAPGSEDTELGVLMEPEVDHGEAEVHAGVQA